MKSIKGKSCYFLHFLSFFLNQYIIVFQKKSKIDNDNVSIGKPNSYLAKCWNIATSPKILFSFSKMVDNQHQNGRQSKYSSLIPNVAIFCHTKVLYFGKLKQRYFSNLNLFLFDYSKCSNLFIKTFVIIMSTKCSILYFFRKTFFQYHKNSKLCLFK